MKKIISLILTFVIMIPLVSCGTEQRPEGDNTLLIWAYGLDDELVEIKKQADKYAEKTGKDVRVVSVDDGTCKKFLDTSESNRPDIYMGLRSEDTQKLLKAKSIDSVPSDIVTKDEYVSEDLYKATSVKGVQYGLPLTQETVALFYNKDMVDKAPETMEELLKMAREDNKKISFAASDYFFSYGFIAAFGGYTFKEDKDGNWDAKDIGVNNKGSLKGYKYLQDMIDHDKTFLGGASDMMASGDFTRGETAFYIGEAGRIRTFNNSNMNFGVAKIPTAEGNDVKPFKYIKMSVVSSVSHNKDVAWDFLKDFKDAQDEIYMNSNPYPPIYKKSLESDSFKNNEKVQGLYNQSLSATIMPNIMENGAINLVIPGYLTELVMNETTPEQCGYGIDKDFKLVIKNVLDLN